MIIQNKDYMQEKFRPQLHYTAQRDQINDPNGLIYANGIYHMFHQYNIFGAVHWGHATSRDLLHWKHEENALQPDRLDQIWSGTCVMDTGNTAGFGENTFIAAFTYGGMQAQGIAYSTDGGYQWKMYEENPVLEGNGKKDFRDPKIFRYYKSGEDKWIMILAAGSCLEFYCSDDLKSWNYLSKWGEEDMPGVIFECPDMFPIYSEDKKNLKWVLLASVMGNGERNFGHAVIYAVGEFNGNKFTNEMKEKQYLDWGMDYYAVQTFYQTGENPDEGRRIALAWQDNWAYREITPTSPFNGQMNLLREISLYKANGDWRLRMRPLREYGDLRDGKLEQKADGSLFFVNSMAEFSVTCDALSENERIFGFTVNQEGECLAKLEADPINEEIRLYRGKSTLVESPYYEVCSTAVCTREQMEQITVYIDKSSLEIILGDGELWMSHLLFPKEDGVRIQFFKGKERTKEIADWKPVDPSEEKQNQSRTVRVEETHQEMKLNINAWNMASIWTEMPEINTDINEWLVIAGKWAQTRRGFSGSDAKAQCRAQAFDEHALALAEAAHWWEFSAEISVESLSKTSMTTVLGEKAAGLAVGMDETGSNGIMVMVDFRESQLMIINKREGKSTVIKMIPVEGEREELYYLKMERSRAGICICLNGETVTMLNEREYGAWIGVCVLDALGHFRNISVKCNKNG